jgi:hypothetical protein
LNFLLEVSHKGSLQIKLGVIMRIRTLLGVCLLGISQLAMAEMPPKPESCPAVAALSSQPFFMAQHPEGTPGYAAIRLGKYNTSENWGFLMIFIEANNMMQAVTIANSHLNDIAGHPEPMAVPGKDMWACLYNVQGTPYQAIAVTPLSMPSESAMIMKSFK